MTFTAMPAPVPPQTSGQIIVLEDDALLRMTLAELLEEQGFTVYQAKSAAEALQMCDDIQGQGVLVADRRLSSVMEYADGHKIAAQALRRWPGLGVIYISGALEDAERSLSSREKMLLKPFSIRTLEHDIRTLLA